MNTWNIHRDSGLDVCTFIALPACFLDKDKKKLKKTFTH